MKTTRMRRTFLAFAAAAAAALVARAAGIGHRRQRTLADFPETTPPGNRARRWMVGDRPIYVREDHLAVGALRDLRAANAADEGRS